MNYQIIQHQHVFRPGQAFGQCHASTLCVLPNGGLMCAWFAGSREGKPDCAIWSAAAKQGVWEAPVKTADADNVPCWNPVLLHNGEKLMLFYKVGTEIPQWQTFVTESADEGASWSAPRELVPGNIGGRGPVKNKCLRLKSGRILAPASIETEKEWYCFTDISDDNGGVWTAGEPVPLDRKEIRGLGAIQPTLWQKSCGTVCMYMRSTEGVILQSESQDEGKTWAPARRTSLPNNNCGIDMTQLPDGRLVLVGNPVGENWGKRSPIAFWVSEDETAEHWSEPTILEYVPCEKNEYRAEFSYPSVVTDGSDVLITYTWKRESIAFWRIRIFRDDASVQ